MDIKGKNKGKMGLAKDEGDAIKTVLGVVIDAIVALTKGKPWFRKK